MIQEGRYSEEDAYQNVIQSVGDVNELFDDLEEKSLLELPEKDRKKRAMLKAVAVGLYIFAGVIFFSLEMISAVVHSFSLSAKMRQSPYSTCLFDSDI
mgnify:CR=1 FL=1